MKSDKYEPGICCPHCSDSLAPEKRASLEERNRQIQIARQKNRAHLGQNVPVLSEKKKQNRRSSQKKSKITP
jgi:UPF0176 protein